MQFLIWYQRGGGCLAYLRNHHKPPIRQARGNKLEAAHQPNDIHINTTTSTHHTIPPPVSSNTTNPSAIPARQPTSAHIHMLINQSAPSPNQSSNPQHQSISSRLVEMYPQHLPTIIDTVGSPGIQREHRGSTPGHAWAANAEIFSNTTAGAATSRGRSGCMSRLRAPLCSTPWSRPAAVAKAGARAAAAMPWA